MKDSASQLALGSSALRIGLCFIPAYLKYFTTKSMATCPIEWWPVVCFRVSQNPFLAKMLSNALKLASGLVHLAISTSGICSIHLLQLVGTCCLGWGPNDLHQVFPDFLRCSCRCVRISIIYLRGNWQSWHSLSNSSILVCILRNQIWDRSKLFMAVIPRWLSCAASRIHFLMLPDPGKCSPLGTMILSLFSSRWSATVISLWTWLYTLLVLSPL